MKWWQKLIRRSNCAAYFPIFLQELRETYILKPIWPDDCIGDFGWNHASFGIRLCLGNREIGFFTCVIIGTKLNITSFGRANKRNLDIPNGAMTEICRKFIEELVRRGLTEIILRDLSGGYWAYFSNKYFPSLKWDGVQKYERYIL